MIVEDRESDAWQPLYELAASDYEVTYERVSSIEAVEEALVADPFDVVIANCCEPGFLALETLDLLRRQDLETPYIVVSDGAGENNKTGRTGDIEYVPKSDLKRLALVVKRVLREARFRHEQNIEGATSQKSEEIYRTVVQQTAESIFLVDPRTRKIMESNPASRKLLGYSSGELSEMTIDEIVSDEERENLSFYVRRTLESKTASDCEYRHCRKDGSTVTVEGSISVISYGEGDALCFVEYDVTGRKKAEEELRQSVDALLAIYEASQLLSSTLESEEIGTRLLKIMQRISSLTTAVISMPDENGDLRVWRAIGFESLWSRVRYTPEAQDALHEVLGTGEHKLLELSHPIRKEESLSTLYLPLRIRERTLGILEVYGPDNLSNGQMVEILISLASKAASALENARLYGKLAEREQRLQELVGKLITAQEEERSRVAYDVHDRLTQMAVAAYQHLQAFSSYQRPGTTGDQELLDKATELIRQTVVESRQVIAGLRPTELDDFGLAASIRQQVDILRKDGWDIIYKEALGGRRLPRPIETALYRVVQEALFNVRKHAGTLRIQIDLGYEGGHVGLWVRDWGQGFNQAGLAAEGPGERVGVSGMRERVALLGGHFDIQTAEGTGTLVSALVPLPEPSDAFPGGVEGSEATTESRGL